jgi:hypothetical protein
MTRSYVALLGASGRPDPTVTADSPYGHAFNGPGGLHLVAVNPTSHARTVTFRRNGQTVGSVSLDPDQARTVVAPVTAE